MRKINKEELKDILLKHKLWLDDEEGGVRADLRSADLRDADLSDANLRYANLDKRYITISRIGSRKSRTIYCFEDDKIWCGCWEGTLDEFETRVLNEYSDKANIHHKEYIGFINYLKSLK